MGIRRKIRKLKNAAQYSRDIFNYVKRSKEDTKKTEDAVKKQ